MLPEKKKIRKEKILEASKSRLFMNTQFSSCTFGFYIFMNVGERQSRAEADESRAERKKEN